MSSKGLTPIYRRDFRDTVYLIRVRAGWFPIVRCKVSAHRNKPINYRSDYRRYKTSRTSPFFSTAVTALGEGVSHSRLFWESTRDSYTPASSPWSTQGEGVSGRLTSLFFLR